MEDRSAQEKYLPLQALRWSWTLVIVCGLLLGYYCLQTYGLPRHRQYQLDFGKAQWIEPAESPAPIAYFRKEIYLSSPPAQAWIEIAASDTFGLVVNGHTIGNLGSVKTFEAGIYDIKRALKVGTNVVAVSISRTSYPGPAQLRLRGQIVAPSGATTQILSDETWRVTNRTGIVEGTEEWNGKRVLDQTWPTARRSPLNDQDVPVSWVDTNPLLLELPRTGSWIMADNASSEAVFSTTINADRSKQETWIQIASAGDLDLAINGHIVTLATFRGQGKQKITAPGLHRGEPSLRSTSMGGSRKIEIPLTKQTAHPSNPSNSRPTTSVTGSREGKTSSLRAFGASTSQPASMSTGSSLKETRSIAFPPMPAGEWAINRIQNRARRKNTRFRLGRMESLPGVICPRTWPALSIIPVLPVSSNLGSSLA